MPLLDGSTVTVALGAAATVTVAVWVTAVLAALVTVSVYVVVAVGLTESAVPLVMARLPGVTTPVPPANTPVRSELEPDAMDVGLAIKLVIAGAATACTVVVFVAGVVPLPPVTVRV
jgi:hypothetical protein